MERYIYIHGHFYQPPRENAWLEAVELQDSAHPFHDWNERITRECYAPNAFSRILDEHGKIVNICNNYSKISFNFGPTLLAWMAEKAPEVYQTILQADKESQKFFSGHGSALAQTYSHMILPLANRRDQYTQVLWGIRDFAHRFGRAPEGLWLPETAVDLGTLEVLARLGIRFTILSPHQARQIRRIRSRAWQDVQGGKIDPSRAYELRLPSRRKINLFFYDGPISRAVAFENLLSNGEVFAGRLIGGFSEGRSWPQLVHIATDGETYGHHQSHGDMALAYALQYMESKQMARLTNYGEYLEKHPPSYEVEIFENSSWSCPHGVERWRSDCGCSSGRNPGWNQSWRAPLREALNWLRDTLVPLYEARGKLILSDPWVSRDDYIRIILDRSPENVDRFFKEHALREFEANEKTLALKLLEMQRHAMLMFTSCGWFFDELSGIETIQVIQYAGRAIQLAREIFGDDLEPPFLERLGNVRGNIAEHPDGRSIYEKFVKPAMVNLAKVGAHYAIRSLFESYAERDQIYCYTVDREDYQLTDAGKMKLAMGRARFTSKITKESTILSFGVLHFGDHNLNGGVQEFGGEEAYRQLLREGAAAFSRADIPETLRVLEKGFGKDIYSLQSLFRDEQRKILSRILNATLAEVETLYRQIYEHHAALMFFLVDSGIPLPKIFHTVVELALNMAMRRIFENDELDRNRVTALLNEARGLKINFDQANLGYTLKETIEHLAERFRLHPEEFSLLQKFEDFVDLGRLLPFEVDFWKPQNVYFELLQTVFPGFQVRAANGDEKAKAWVDHFMAAGEKLSFRIS